MSETSKIYPSPSSAIIDSDSRDPNGLNKHFQLDFFNIIAEPDPSAYSFQLTHKASRQIYQYTKLFIYRLLTIFVGLPLMLCWGLIFGLYTFGMIWFAVPIRRLCQSGIHEFGIYIQTISDAIIGPLHRSYGQMFSNIRMTLFTEQIPSTKEIQV